MQNQIRTSITKHERQVKYGGYSVRGRQHYTVTHYNISIRNVDPDQRLLLLPVIALRRIEHALALLRSAAIVLEGQDHFDVSAIEYVEQRVKAAMEPLEPTALPKKEEAVK